MRITYLHIRNFRAIEDVSINADHSMIVVAGPNGCGKSCVLDAIRFVKSAYGGYQTDEWQQWLGEFQIDRRRDPWEMRKILRNKENIATLSIKLKLHKEERTYLQEHADSLMEEIAFNQVFPGSRYEGWRHRIKVADQDMGVQIMKMQELKVQFIQALQLELEREIHSGRVTIHETGNITLARNLVLESVWRTYDPKRVGLVDYHGSQRYYAREQFGVVNLNLKTQEEQQRTNKLYNYANKYSNIKTQMATEFVLRNLREQSGATGELMNDSLAETMSELFRRFFPGKQFHGVRTNQLGELEFSVTVGDGKKHDIDDLSSGEKEILFGYLRLRNLAERQSIILLDEPELHLNPRLIRGLPQFYQKYICEELDNQIWTVTHSDAFLREAMECSGAVVFHMKEVHRDQSRQNQVRKLEREAVADVLFELIGDIAGYNVDGKLIIFESEDSEFDRYMTAKLFPEYERKMNFISGGNKSTVRKLHDALERQSTNQDGRIVFSKIFSIIDNDGDEIDQSRVVDDNGKFTWDVYHIENYLLDEKVIFKILKRGSLQSTGFNSESEIHDTLRAIAAETIDSLVEDWVRRKTHQAIRKAIRLKGERSDGEAGTRVNERVIASIERLNSCVRGELSKEMLNEIARSRQKFLRSSLESNDWKKHIPGRAILRVFTNQSTPMRYDLMRNMIISTMAEEGVRPLGMLRILERIDKSK